MLDSTFVTDFPNSCHTSATHGSEVQDNVFHRREQPVPERQKTLDTLNLVFASGPGELATGFDDLANASRADRMAITDEAAAGVHRQREGRNSGSDLGAHVRQRRRPGLQ